MSIGEVLAAARTDAGMSVEDLSRATKIRGQLIRDIEADDYSHCGGTVYARGHVRALAGVLGLDPVAVLAEFDRAHDRSSDAPHAREIFEHEVIDVPHRSSPNWTAAMAVAAAVLLVVALVSLFNTDGNRPPASLAAENTPSPSASAAPRTPAEPSPKGEDPLAGLVNEGGVFVRVRVVNTRSWVAAEVDGKPAFGKTLAAGAQMDFKGTRLVHLTIGNAGAVQLVVNGRDLGVPGRAGAVLRLDFGPGDPAGSTSG